MKKYLFSLIFVLALTAFNSSESFAQQYFVYDGDTFSVMLTTNSANTQVIKVQFSSNGQWVDFAITDYEDLEHTADGGFVYHVLDGQGKKFYIDYYRNGNRIHVYDDGNGDWYLSKRQ